MDSDEDHKLTELIIGLAMKVHRKLGPGFLESVYRNALTFELRRSGLSLEVHKPISVRYEDVVVGDFFTDIIVNDALICELKANAALTKVDEVQLVNYLTATNHDIGLLINFGATSLQFKRKYRRPACSPEDVDLQNPVNPV